jgi:HAE1 family hydrophobic/amphiphilic exporter-1
MATIPLALIGVIFGLIITGLPFSVMTLIAVVALAGIVVNDSLVLVDFVNRERQSGTDRWNSLINAGMTRLRPILMTTVTTIAGFMPMILSTSSATADYKPLAVAIAFGLSFGTLLTLFVIPVLYSYVDSFFGRFKLTRFKSHISFTEAMIIRGKHQADPTAE